MRASWLTVLGLVTACSSAQPEPVRTPVQTKIDGYIASQTIEGYDALITLTSGSGILSLIPS